jgi:hypothetical protein
MKPKINKDKKVMRIQARFSIEEWREIEKKAHLYTDGNFSRWLRLAAISHKPLK